MMIMEEEGEDKFYLYNAHINNNSNSQFTQILSEDTKTALISDESPRAKYISLAFVNIHEPNQSFTYEISIEDVDDDNLITYNDF